MYDKFYAYLGDLEENLRKLSELLGRKLIALESEDILALDDIMKEEQVYVLISKGFDANIDNHRAALGLNGTRLSEIIEELPEAEQPRYRSRFQTLSSALTEAKTLEDKCRTLTEERLHTIDKMVREMDRVAVSSTYDSSGGKPGGDQARMLRTSI